jgi:hypothetical protein
VELGLHELHPQIQIDRLLEGHIHIDFLSASGGGMAEVSHGL